MMSGVQIQGRLTSSMLQDMEFIGLVIEGFFYGFYAAIFFMYIQCQASKEAIDKRRNILLYPTCVLYILSTATFILDIIIIMNVELLNLSPSTPKSVRILVQELHFTYASITMIGLCGFISQSILIYRCWVIWGCNIGVIIIPSISALAGLTTWLATNGSVYILLHEVVTSYRLTLTSLFISLIVHAVVTGLIVLRILKVYWEVRHTFQDQTLGGTTPKLWSIMFIVIESGMAMFTTLLIRVVLTILQLDALHLIITIRHMFNGITPTIILVRVSMGLSYHDEKSMVETAGSLWFASHDQNLISGTGGIDHESILDDIDIQ